MNIDDMIAQVAAKGPDQSQAKKGFDLPPEGTARARIVEIIELGKHDGEYKGKKKINDKIVLGFELSGKGYEPRDTDDGPVPIVLRSTMNLSQGDNSAYFKMFSRIRGEAKNIVQLLGNRAAFLVKITHSEDKKYANIDFESIRPAYLEQLDDEGEVVKVPIKVAEALTPLKLFVWDFATPEMWDSIFIEGEWEEKKDDSGKVTKPAQSKNKYQEQIRKANNFDSLPCYDYAKGTVSKAAQEAVDKAVGETTPVPPAAAEDPNDPMAGIG